MNLKKEYQELYDKWHQEFKQAELTPLSEDTFNYYKNLIKRVTMVEVENEMELKVELLETYKKNITFIFEDLLKLREVKVMNSALILKELDVNNLTEAEKLLYQNLVATVKGYKKVKAFTTAMTKESSIPKPIIEPTPQSIENVKPIEAEKNTVEEPIVPIDVEQILDKSTEKNIDFHYTLIRFINKAPPLVGLDLKYYGPFEENDIANIPFQNAIILINEKYAEKIENT
jgi:DNA replication initiation complex subunit (GINS family)